MCKTNVFIEKARKVHGDKYDYSKVEYVNNKTKVCIICPIHGEFWQTPSNHLLKTGCPFCVHSCLEDEISQLLKEYNIAYERQKTFSWLKVKSLLRLDFFIPQLNLGIECQGEQHFFPIKHFGGEEKFFQVQKYDEIKYKLCNEHGIKILYFTKDAKYIPQNSQHLFKTKNNLKEIFKYNQL